VAENFTVKITGAAELANRLRRFDKDAWKILRDELSKAGDAIASEAKRNVTDDGLSGWGNWFAGRTKATSGTRGSLTLIAAAKAGRDLSFSSSKVSAGFKPQVASRTQRGNVQTLKVRVAQMDAAGAIFEMAGRRNKSGHAFNANLLKKRGDGPWPRTLGPALYKEGGDASLAIEVAVQAAMDRVNNSSSS